MTSAQLRRPATWLNLARWLVAAYAVAQVLLMATGVALFADFARRHVTSDALTPNDAWKGVQVQAALTELGWPATSIAWVSVSRDLVSVLVTYPLVLVLLFRPPLSGFRIFVALVFTLIAPLGGVTLLPLVERLPGLAALKDVPGAVSWQLFFMLFYLFPDGRPTPRWTRWLIVVWGSFVAVQVLTAGQVSIFGEGADSGVADVVFLAMVALVLLAIGSQVYRYLRRSGPIQRQQTKLVVLCWRWGPSSSALAHRFHFAHRLKTSLASA